MSRHLSNLFTSATALATMYVVSLVLAIWAYPALVFAFGVFSMLGGVLWTLLVQTHLRDRRMQRAMLNDVMLPSRRSGLLIIVAKTHLDEGVSVSDWPISRREGDVIRTVTLRVRDYIWQTMPGDEQTVEIVAVETFPYPVAMVQHNEAHE